MDTMVRYVHEQRSITVIRVPYVDFDYDPAYMLNHMDEFPDVTVEGTAVYLDAEMGWIVAVFDQNVKRTVQSGPFTHRHLAVAELNTHFVPK